MIKTASKLIRDKGDDTTSGPIMADRRNDLEVARLMKQEILNLDVITMAFLDESERGTKKMLPEQLQLAGSDLRVMAAQRTTIPR